MTRPITLSNAKLNGRMVLTIGADGGVPLALPVLGRRVDVALCRG